MTDGAEHPDQVMAPVEAARVEPAMVAETGIIICKRTELRQMTPILTPLRQGETVQVTELHYAFQKQTEMAGVVW